MFRIIQNHDPSFFFISMSEFKNMLGEEARCLPDDEIKRLYDDQYNFARLAFTRWGREKRLSQDISKNR